jgi:hypothetical protein
MPKTKISEFSATPANNTDIDSINIAEGCAPSGINDAIRELMAQLKDFQTGAVGDSFNGPVGTTTAAAGAFTTLSSTGNTTLGDASGDSVTINGTATFANANPTLSAGTANGVTYLNGSKVVTSGSALTFDGQTLTNTRDTPILVLNDTAASNSALRLLSTGGISYIQSGISGGSFASLVFTANGGGSEQMRLTSTGLGIGTSSPSYKLDVNGQARLGGSTGLVFGVGTAFAGGQAEIYSTSTTPMGLGTTGAAVLRLYTNSTLQATLDSSGNLGLGVTPSAWNTYKALEIGRVGNYFAGYSGGTELTLGANAYYSTGWKYAVTGALATRYMTDNIGGHYWYNAPSGTAGNAITFTQAATLTSSGDYLVGTTSSQGLLSNTTKIVGGNFITRQATTASLANTATEDITGLISGAAYTVVCRGDTNTTTFVIQSVYVNGAGGVTLGLISNGNSFVLTSPANNTLRVTGLVTTQTYTYSLTRIF